MKKLIGISLGMLLTITFAIAQEQRTINQQADNLFERYEYFKSLNLYLKLAGKKNPPAGVIERIADCYRNINQYQEAEQWYARAVTEAQASSTTHYYYAEVLLRNQKFSEAKQQYRLFFIKDPVMLAKKLATCDSAITWMKNESVYKVDNVAVLNTEYSDWGLTYSGKESLIFTSDRTTGNSKTDNRTGNNWFKLYLVDSAGKVPVSLQIAKGGKNLFSDNFHIGPVTMNSSADTAYITVTTDISKKNLPVEKALKQNVYTRRLQIVVAAITNGHWTVIGSFPYNNVQKYSIGNAALSADRKILYFTSDMPGGIGKTDIWYCEKNVSGKWGSPVNCGKTINTKEEEDFPTIANDGTLYYASKGLAGMGGYDIFMAKGQKESWSVPSNLKYPINSTSDDFYLTTNNGSTGYFSSNREGGKGNDDIYSYTRQVPDTLLAAKKQVQKPGGQPIILQNLVLKPIYYDLDKSAIRPDAVPELDTLALVLRQNPRLNIIISSYTDSRASYQYNIALSQRRSFSVVEYLVQKGISASRMTAAYYGENNLVTNCPDNVDCTETEHQLNRRTEFKITELIK